MGTSVHVKPLCGLYNETPLSYLVSVDGFNFLIDCDWNDHFDIDLLKPLSSYVCAKCVASLNCKSVKCSLVYMDFEGHSHGSSIKKILSHVSPSKLGLVHGSTEATEHLKQHCLKTVCQYVYTPDIEESIDITSDLCAL